MVPGDRRARDVIGGRLGLIVLTTLLTLASSARPEEPPEARRLDSQAFREGLRQRGLVELLELHLGESPPQDAADAELLRRELLLVTAEDPSLSPEQRRAARVQADDIFRSLIAAHPKDPRALDWRLELGRSLLYRRGEPYVARVLYRGGSELDRRRLAEITDQAVGVFNALLSAIEVELDRLDNLSLAEYDRAERRGHIEHVERMQPQVEAMRRWAVFYRSLTRELNDPTRINDLRVVAQDLRSKTELLTTPHEVSHYQCQSLLLSGMIAGRLGDYALAVEQLDGAVDVVERLVDPIERRDLHWVATLARLERVRALRDFRRFDRALDGVEDFRAWVTATAPANFGLELVAALLETSVLQAQADRAAAAGKVSIARGLHARSVRPLMALARKNDDHRDGVYRAVYEALDRDCDPRDLHPFERCALIAGLIADANAAQPPAGPEPRDAAQRQARPTRLLDRAIDVATSLLADGTILDPDVHAETLYNLGVARHRRGQRFESAEAFVAVGRDFPDFRLAQRAATLGAQAAWEVYQDHGLRDRPEVRDLYLEALAVLTDRYPGSAAARYWRFFRAQTLEEIGRFAEAAGEYLEVGPDHDFHLQARFRHADCLARVARELADSAEADPGEQIRQAVAAIGAARQFIHQARQQPAAPPGQPTVRRLVARTLLNQAEMSVLPGVDRYGQALAILDGFEQEHGQATDLIGRVLRVRIIAYQALGRLADAKQAIPRYIDSDPANAGPTLQGLFEALGDDVRRLRRAGRTDQAHTKAASALLLAREIDAWARRPDSGIAPAQRRALRVQLAEACLQANEPDRARQLFTECLETDSASEAPANQSARTMFGLAEALFQLKRYPDALSLYNRLYRELQPASAVWWQALLGDLRCRTELGDDPQGVVRVIRQHRFLHPDMGGAQLRARFEELLERNRPRDQRPD